MGMDELLNAGESVQKSRKANVKELLEKLKSQSNEETKKRLDSFLQEMASIVEFAQGRIDEVSSEYEEIAALGSFGAVISVALTGKPLAYGACGSSKGISTAMKFAMLRTMAHEFEGSSEKSDDDDGDDSSGEDD